MFKAWMADLLGWSAILIWVGCSAYFYGVGEAGLFQSAGTIGIAAAVGYFALQRHAVPLPYGAVRTQALQRKQSILAADAAAHALARCSVLAKELVNYAQAEGRSPSSAVVTLAGVDDAHIDRILTSPSDRHSAEIEEIALAQTSANEQVLRVRSRAEAAQAIVVIIGTLQSGFGSALLEISK